MSSWPKVNASRVLIVSDDLHLATLLQNMMGDAGYYVRQSYSVSDAMHMAEQIHFDLALLDLRVSGNDAQAILEALREDMAFGRFPWVALMDSDPEPQVPDGAAGVVMLPVRAHQLLNTVSETLRRLEALKERTTLPPEMTSGEEDVHQLLARNLLEYKTLSDITRTLNSTLDLNAVLTKVVDAATRLTYAEEGLLLLPDDAGKTLYVRAGKGIDSETARQFRVRTKDSLAGQVFNTGDPMLIAYSGWYKVKTAYYVRSLLYVPMKVKGQVIGVLGVNNRTSDRTFTDHDRTLLEDLASHAAIAIENARLYGETVTRSTELTTLVKASEAVNSTLALPDVLRIITEQLIEAMNVEWCEITAWDKDSGQLNVLASRRQVQWSERKIAPRLALADSQVFRQVMEQKQALPTAEMAEGPYLIAHHSKQSWLVPLYATPDAPAIGVLELLYFEEPRAALPDLPEVQRIGLMLALQTEPDEMTDTIFAQQVIARLLQDTGAEMARLWALDSAEQSLYQRFNIGCGVWLAPHQPRIALNELPPLLEALQKAMPINITGYSEAEASTDALLVYYHAQAVLALPMLISGQVLGLVLLIDTSQTRDFGEREVNLAQALVLQAANALQNARLFHDLQNSLEELRRTQAKLVQSARMSAIGELAAAVAHQINNPLTTVLADTEMLLQDKPAEDKDVVSLQAVLRAGQRAREVVRRLLGMAYQDREDATPEPMDINTSIENTLSLVSGHIRRSRVELVIELAENLPLASGLRGQLEDVWLNLLLNARDAVKIRDKPVIGIKSFLSEDKAWVQVKVWDNGVGIPDTLQKDVFEAFFTTKPSGEGTGLGLHICRQIVAKCSGRIDVEAVQPSGVAFIVSLPVQRVSVTDTPTVEPV
jgi:signal transduction histidine kinase/DNA-binding response OmpR family regulator